jgi:hypothetical protein
MNCATPWILQVLMLLIMLEVSMVGIDYLYKWSIGSLDLTIVKGKY